MKFIRPLYRALFASRIGRQTALDTFAEWKANYHPIAAKMLAHDLKVEPPAAVPGGVETSASAGGAGGLQNLLSSPMAVLGVAAVAVALVKRAGL